MEIKAREDITAAERKQDLAALAKAIQNGALRGVDDDSLLRSQEAYQALMRKNMEAALMDGNNEEIARLLQIGKKFGVQQDLEEAAEARLGTRAQGERPAASATQTHPRRHKRSASASSARGSKE